jgi:hypothetical protein
MTKHVDPRGLTEEGRLEHLDNLRAQQRATERALRKLARLRKKAADEIERLLSFLDDSDEYVQTELEASSDEEEGDDSDDEPDLTPGEAANQERAWLRWTRTGPHDPEEADDADREGDELDKLECGDDEDSVAAIGQRRLAEYRAWAAQHPKEAE